VARSDVPSPSGDFCAELTPGAWYCLSLADIARLTPVAREGGRRAMPADWDSVLLKYVNKTNPYCAFSCDQNRVKKVNSRKKNTPFSRGTLKCTFPGCSVSAVVKIWQENNDQLEISYSGKLRHGGSVHHGRRIKGAARDEIKRALDGSDLSRVHHRLLSNLPEKVCASGNRDGEGSHKVLQKMSSERNLPGRPFIDAIQSLAHLRAHFVKEDQEMYSEHVKKESGPHLFGYIQSVSLYPTIVTMWTEADLRLYFDMARNGAVFFDATSKIARKVFNDTGPILYYPLVLSHPTSGKAPIAVAEMFSSSHAVPTLTNFFSRRKFIKMNFRRDVMKLHRGRPANPAHLEIDLSWASLHSCLRGLFDENLGQYFDRNFSIVIALRWV